MHIPSKRVEQEMRSEIASTWYVPANGGEEVALLIKAPTTSIKALYAGCSLGLVFGKVDGHLCTGIRVYDIPEKPLLISGIQRYAEEHSALSTVLALRKVPVFLFNEMDVCLAWAEAELSEADALEIQNFIEPLEDLYVGQFSEKASHCLDCFCYTIDSVQTVEGAYAIETIEISPQLGEWTAGHLSFIGSVENHSVLIDSQNEGEVLEKAVWASLESVFLRDGFYPVSTDTFE